MNNEYSPLENFLNAPMIDYYKKHPEEFIEEILRIKLEPYQKEMLKGLYKNDYGFMAYLLVKNGENRVVNEDALGEYYHKMLLEQYKRF